jgi:hypothetical protein
MATKTTTIPIDWTDQRELGAPVAMVFNLAGERAAQAQAPAHDVWAAQSEAERAADAARNQLDMFPDAAGARRVQS